MTAGKIFSLFFGALGVVIGTVLATTAFIVLIEKPDDGFLTTDAHTFERPSNAIVSEDIDLFSDAPRWVVDVFADPAEVRITGGSASGNDQFVGIGRTIDVDRYLSGVNHDEIRSIEFNNEAVVEVRYDNHPGTAAPPAPATQDFWVASSDGAGTQVLEWDIDAGNWTVVAMNSDGSAGVDADLEFGLKISKLGTIAWSVFGFGVVTLLLGGVMFYRGLQPPKQVDPPAPQPPIVEGPSPQDRGIDLREYVAVTQPPVPEPRVPTDPLLG